MKRSVVLLLLIGALPFMAFGQAAGSPDITNFALTWEINSGNFVYLYPETAYDVNPSVLMSIERPYLMPNLGLSGSSSQTVNTRRDATIGALGGTLTSTTTNRNLIPAATLLMPLSPAMVAGLMAEYQNQGGSTTSVDSKYTSATSDITTVSGKSLTNLVIAKPYFATKLGDFNVGVSPCVYYSIIPGDKLFNTTTDAASNGGALYYTGGPQTSTITTNLAAVLGASTATDKLTAGIGLSGRYNTTDLSNLWDAVDTDGNGFNDSIVTDKTYYLNTTWGLAAAAYSNQDVTNTVSVGVTPSAVYMLTPDVSLVGSVNWIPYETVTTKQHFHTTTTDKSQYQQTTSYGIFNVAGVGGVELSPFKGSRLRVGLGYSGYNWTTLYTDTNAAGTSTLTSGNPGYFETNLGAQPDNGTVAGTLGSANYDAYTNNTVLLLTGFRWNIVPKVTIFSQLSGSLAFTDRIYRVFNTADNKVWQEDTPGTSFSIGADSIVGVAIQVSDKALFSISSSNATGNLAGSLGRTGDGIPRTGGTATTTTTTASSTSSTSSFSLNLNFVLGL